MATIAIVDDNPVQSGTILNNIEIAIHEFGSEFKVIATLPFPNPNDYFNFISSNDICVLILDEKLNDQPIDKNGPIDYKGSQLVTFLRHTLKDFPIYSVTNYDGVEDLQAKAQEFEEIIKRADFIKDTNKYFARIVRAANNYLRENLDELSQYNILTAEISGGNKDPQLLKELLALQVKLELPYSGFDDRNAWLNEYELLVESLENLNKIIKSKLDQSE